MYWLRSALVGVGLLITSFAALLILARHLPKGLAKDLVGFLPACAITLHHLHKDARVPRSVKIAVAVAAAYVVSPVDLIPDFIPVVGLLDEVVVVAFTLRYAARRVPREVIEEAWTGERHILDRLLGPTAAGRS